MDGETLMRAVHMGGVTPDPTPNPFKEYGIRKYTKTLVVIVLVATALSACIATDRNSAVLKIESFDRLNEIVSNDFNFNYLSIYFSDGIMTFLYGYTDDNGKERFIELKTGNRDKEGVDYDIFRQHGLDEIQNNVTNSNMLTHDIIFEIFKVALANSECLKKYTNNNGNLEIGNITFDVQEGKVDLIYLEPQYNIGASEVCAFELNPLRIVRSARRIN